MRLSAVEAEHCQLLWPSTASPDRLNALAPVGVAGLASVGILWAVTPVLLYRSAP